MHAMLACYRQFERLLLLERVRAVLKYPNSRRPARVFLAVRFFLPNDFQLNQKISDESSWFKETRSEKVLSDATTRQSRVPDAHH